MAAFIEAPAVLPMPVSQTHTFANRLSNLPEELMIQILEYSITLPGIISKKDFWGGKCEWPGCLCESSNWEHVPGERLTNDTLIPLMATPDPIPRLAQYVFYRSNTFHICDPQSDMDWGQCGWWLPPPNMRQWIRRLEIEIFVEDPRITREPGRTAQFLRHMQRAVEEFTELRALRLMFETAFVTTDSMLEMLDGTWSTLQPFRFLTPKLVLEACSAYPAWSDGSESNYEGDLVRDERLERLLAKHVSATGTVKGIGEQLKRPDGEGHAWQGKL